MIVNETTNFLKTNVFENDHYENDRFFKTISIKKRSFRFSFFRRRFHNETIVLKKKWKRSIPSSMHYLFFCDCFFSYFGWNNSLKYTIFTLCLYGFRNSFQKLKHGYLLIHNWGGKGFKGTVVNLLIECHFEITFPCPILWWKHLTSLFIFGCE